MYDARSARDRPCARRIPPDHPLAGLRDLVVQADGAAQRELLRIYLGEILMCEPTTMMMGASLALGAANTGLSMFGQSQQAGASAAQAQYMAQVARNNEIIAKR